MPTLQGPVKTVAKKKPGLQIWHAPQGYPPADVTGPYDRSWLDRHTTAGTLVPAVMLSG